MQRNEAKGDLVMTETRRKDDNRMTYILYERQFGQKLSTIIKSPSASLQFKGLPIKFTTVKWSTESSVKFQ